MRPNDVAAREPRAWARPGFTLVEVVVAALVLQLGLMAALTMAVGATRTVHRARATERLVSALTRIADSLAACDSVSAGRIDRAGATVAWARGTAPEVVASAAGADTVRIVLWPQWRLGTSAEAPAGSDAGCGGRP